MASTTPQPLDTSTPSKDSDIETRLELHQIKLQPKEQHLTQAKKVVENLEKMNFLDTGTLTNAYEFEKHSIWHWPCTTNLEDTIRQTNLYKHIKTRE